MEEKVEITKKEYDFLLKLKSYVVQMYQCESSDAGDYYYIIRENCPELEIEIESGIED